jgi:transaldolase/glucose-6-phosphate isomerase
MTSATSSTINPLKALQQHGQSVWLDYIRRDLITSGELKRLIDEDGLRGMTSNPAIFEKAITGSTDYTDAIAALSSSTADPKAVYEGLAFADIRDVADLLRPVYDETKRRDGYVSLEVSPTLAHDTAGTLAEARRLWSTVGRPNVMIKVPGTPEGLPAIEELLAEGINVNITLLFAQAVYERVAEAYIRALERVAARGGDVASIASVASFFVSRIDTLVDARAASRLEATTDPGEQALLQRIMGRVAIANAKLTYQRYREIFSGPRWQALADRGAQTQRVLWASTSTKNPAYRDVLYVEELIGPDTVNTIPPATFDAFRDHGRLRPSLCEDLDDARETMDALAGAGISMDEVTRQLLVDAVRLFVEPFEKLLAAVAKQMAAPGTSRVNRQTAMLPPALDAAVKTALAGWQADDGSRRLWSRDASLWTGADEANWLGWLTIAGEQAAAPARFEDLAADVRREGFAHAVLLGMGGSSLCPEVLASTFGRQPGHPELIVLDSTDPAQVLALERAVDLARTLFIVASKSGSTLEPNVFTQYFFERIRQVVGAGEAGRRFIAITDPGSALQRVAERDGFRRVYFGLPSIGGRFSALSDFGLVPAAIAGLDVAKLLDRAADMVRACAPAVPADENPGVVLGAILGVAARSGRDKMTVIASPGIHDLGAWLEQLVAESTGKSGTGIIPVDRESTGAPAVYGDDRLFVYLRLQTGPDAAQDAAVSELEAAGHPVVRIAIDEVYDIGEEFFRWEIATAVAGSLLGINPFDQPDVEASKVATRRLTSEFERLGAMPAEIPILEDRGVMLFADAANTSALAASAGPDRLLAGYLSAHLGRLVPGDYVALLAYLPMSAENEAALQMVRQVVRDSRRVATCLGFGPRFLHSTGQAYKGGPNTGVFIQVTCDDAVDLRVPGQPYTFGIVKAAQARGDFQVLAERGRRALRVHLGADVATGLQTLGEAVREALALRFP